MIQRTEYGYRSELGEHEIWAESPQMLAQAILSGSFDLKHTTWERVQVGRSLHLISDHERSELYACSNDEPRARLPQHFFVMVAVGAVARTGTRSNIFLQAAERGPDVIVKYKLVVRETFRSEHG